MTSPPVAELKPHEVEVLRGLVKGLTYAQIGEEIGVHMETVKKRLDGIRDKVGLRTKVELALWASRNLPEDV